LEIAGLQIGRYRELMPEEVRSLMPAPPKTTRSKKSATIKQRKRP
jgi:hypothetical protein